MTLFIDGCYMMIITMMRNLFGIVLLSQLVSRPLTHSFMFHFFCSICYQYYFGYFNHCHKCSTTSPLRKSSILSTAVTSIILSALLFTHCSGFLDYPCFTMSDHLFRFRLYEVIRVVHGWF